MKIEIDPQGKESSSSGPWRYPTLNVCGEDGKQNQVWRHRAHQCQVRGGNHGRASNKNAVLLWRYMESRGSRDATKQSFPLQEQRSVELPGDSLATRKKTWVQTLSQTYSHFYTTEMTIPTKEEIDYLIIDVGAKGAHLYKKMESLILLI